MAADRDSSLSTRGTLRTLQVLRSLNMRNGATVVELSRDTGIPRGSLYRVLETLREMGYVALDLTQSRYCLTALVRTLAEGFTEEDWVVHIARPILAGLQKALVWPVDLGTFMDNAIWIRETTRQMSPLTVDRRLAGMRASLMLSAAGRAYLAWCPAEEREQILRNLMESGEEGVDLLADRQRFDALLEDTRTRGYGSRIGGILVDTNAIAVPILAEDRVLGCLNMTVMRRAMTPEKAAERYLGALNKAAQEIAAGAARLQEESGRTPPP